MPGNALGDVTNKPAQFQQARRYTPKKAPVQTEREKLLLALLYPKPGTELGLLIKFYSPDSIEEKWNAYVRASLDLEFIGMAKAHSFGSVATGLALKDSSVDIYLEPREGVHEELFLRILRRSIVFTQVRSIRRCRKPVILCKHIVSEKRVEISVSKPVATYTSNLIGQLVKRDARLRELFLFLKIWAKKLKLIADDGMTSYCLYVLVIVSLQNDLQSPSISPIEVRGVRHAFDIDLIPQLSDNTTTLDLLKAFFSFYKLVEFEKSVVVPRLGCVVDKRVFYTYQAKRMPSAFQLNRFMSVQDLFNMELNVAKGVTQNKMKYFKQSTMLAAKAFRDPELLAQPVKLFDYLLFGLPDKVVQEEEPQLEPEAVAEPDQPETELITEFKIEPESEPDEDEPMAPEQQEEEFQPEEEFGNLLDSQPESEPEEES